MAASLNSLPGFLRRDDWLRQPRLPDRVVPLRLHRADGQAEGQVVLLQVRVAVPEEEMTSASQPFQRLRFLTTQEKFFFLLDFGLKFNVNNVVAAASLVLGCKLEASDKINVILGCSGQKILNLCYPHCSLVPLSSGELIEESRIYVLCPFS